MLNQNIARAVGDSDLAGSSNFKSRVVGTILFGFLSHQTDIRHRAHGGRVEGAIFATVANGFFENFGVTAIRDHGLHIMQPVIWSPHFTGLTNSGGHRSIDDDIAGYVQVGNAAARVHHGQVRTFGQAGIKICLDQSTLVCWQAFDLVVGVADPIVSVEAKFLEYGGMFV